MGRAGNLNAWLEPGGRALEVARQAETNEGNVASTKRAVVLGIVWSGVLVLLAPYDDRRQRKKTRVDAGAERGSLIRRGRMILGSAKAVKPALYSRTIPSESRVKVCDEGSWSQAL